MSSFQHSKFKTPMAGYVVVMLLNGKYSGFIHSTGYIGNPCKKKANAPNPKSWLGN
jgi:hypothetical protein